MNKSAYFLHIAFVDHRIAIKSSKLVLTQRQRGDVICERPLAALTKKLYQK